MSIFAGVTREQLAGIPLFEGLDGEALDAIAARSLFIGAHPDLKIIEKGESGFDFYIILSGEAEVMADGNSIARLGPGEVFGEMALEGYGKRNADVVARTIMSLLTMMIWDYRTVEREHPEIGERLRRLAQERSGG